MRSYRGLTKVPDPRHLDAEDVPDNGPAAAPMTHAEALLSAEVILLLELEAQVDSRRLQVWAQDKVVYVQGSVSSYEQRELCKELLKDRVGILRSELTLQVS